MTSRRPPTASFNNTYGRLGELAGFEGKPDDWCHKAEERLMERYYGDLDGIVYEVKRVAQAAKQGIEGAPEALATLQQDYAASWLVRQIRGDDLPDLAEQEHHWKSAFIAAPDRQLALTLAVAGFDTVNARIDDDPPLFGFVFSASADEIDEFMNLIPQAQRAAQINRKGHGDMTAVHIASFASGPGSLAVLQGHGGDLAALMDITLVTGEVIRGNPAHLAVMNGRVDMTAELMALDRGLFTRYAPEVKYTPDEMVDACAKVTVNINKDIRKAANVAAYAIDRPVPFPEVGWVIKQLAPSTAPRPQLARHLLN